jgi:hypothetical protein
MLIISNMIHIYIYIYMCVCEREREREGNKIYIYIYIYICPSHNLNYGIRQSNCFFKREQVSNSTAPPPSPLSLSLSLSLSIGIRQILFERVIIRERKITLTIISNLSVPNSLCIFQSRITNQNLL